MIEVVETPRAARRAPIAKPGLVHLPRSWSRYEDVEDAEIVSEERLAS